MQCNGVAKSLELLRVKGLAILNHLRTRAPLPPVAVHNSNRFKNFCAPSVVWHLRTQAPLFNLRTLSSAIALYVMDKKLMDLNTRGIITDETIDFWPTKVKSKLEFEMTLLALITPSIQHHIQTQKLHIRDQLLHSQDYFDCHNLNDDQINLYNDWWTKTTIVSIADKASNFSPFRREPPWISPSCRP